MNKNPESKDTKDANYTNRLMRLEEHWIKKILQPINPYKWNIRRMGHGKVLDIGCGIGRNLRYLSRTDAVGVDHNQDSVDYVTKLGFQAWLPSEFKRHYQDSIPEFDTLLISHVLEHLTTLEASALIAEYLPFLKQDGQIVVICPQQAGYRSDVSHVTYFSDLDLEKLLLRHGVENLKRKSFPLPVIFGKIFIYNEHLVYGVRKNLLPAESD